MRSSHSQPCGCVCECCEGLWGWLHVILMGGKGLCVGTRDHSRPKRWVRSRVGLRINQEALVAGDRNPSQSSLGPEGIYWLT